MKYIQLYLVPTVFIWFVLGNVWYHNVVTIVALLLGLVVGSMWGEGLRRYQVTQ